MHKIADLCQKNKDELATIESTDNGKSVGMAKHDIDFGIDILRYYAGWTDKMHGKQIPMTGNFMQYTQRVPMGVCG